MDSFRVVLDVSLGMTLDELLGALDGLAESPRLGLILRSDGLAESLWLGSLLGASLGELLVCTLGVPLGVSLEVALGTPVGSADGG